jgi:hypothetical protein
MRHQRQKQTARFAGTAPARIARCRLAPLAYRAHSPLLRAAGLLASAAVLALAGCASSGIGLQQDGTYALATRESGMDCPGLAKRIGEELEVLKSLPDAAKAEREQVAPTAVAAVGRLFSSDGGLAALAKYDRERAHVRALQRMGADKGCPALDVDAQLAKSDAAIAELRSP